MENGSKPVDDAELKAWFQTLLITGAISFTIFLVQNFVRPVFNLAFQISVIYIPMLIALLIYVKIKTSTKKLQKHIRL